MKGYIILFVFCFFLIGCQTVDDSHIRSELENKGISVKGHPEIYHEILPTNFSDLPWALIHSTCEQGGYDLMPYAGQSVTSYSYQSNDVYGLGKSKAVLTVEVMTQLNNIICVHYGQDWEKTRYPLIPGILAVNDSAIK